MLEEHFLSMGVEWLSEGMGMLLQHVLRHIRATHGVMLADMAMLLTFATLYLANQGVRALPLTVVDQSTPLITHTRTTLEPNRTLSGAASLPPLRAPGCRSTPMSPVLTLIQ